MSEAGYEIAVEEILLDYFVQTSFNSFFHGIYNKLLLLTFAWMLNTDKKCRLCLRKVEIDYFCGKLMKLF